MRRPGRCGIMISGSAGPAPWSVSIRKRRDANARPTIRRSARRPARSPRSGAGSAITRSASGSHKGIAMNHRKLYRLNREDDPLVRRKRGRKRARGSRSPSWADSPGAMETFPDPGDWPSSESVLEARSTWPFSGGRSRQGEAGRASRGTAATNRRFSDPLRPQLTLPAPKDDARFVPNARAQGTSVPVSTCARSPPFSILNQNKGISGTPRMQT